MEPFKKISAGGIKKAPLIRRLIDAGIQFNDYAHILFENPSFAPDSRPEELQLLKLSLADLSLNRECSYRKVLDQASKFGLKLCPMYLAAFLRLDYMDQPEGPYLTVASQELAVDKNYPTGFYIRNIDNSFWLRGYRVEGEPEWPAENKFIFVK